MVTHNMKESFVAVFTGALLLLLFVGNCAGANNTFTNSDQTYQATWSFTQTTITFTVTAATGTGWVGIGFSSTPSMTDSDVYVGWLTAAGTAVVTDRYATAYAMPQEDTTMGGTNDVSNVAGSLTADGRTSVTFTRPLVTSDKYDTKLGPNVVSMLWAYGADGSVDDGAGTFSKHTAMGTVQINLVTNEQTPDVLSGLDLFALHASLMVVSVCVLFFPGMLLARFYKIIFPKWFYIHALTQTLGIFGVFSAFIIIFRAKQNVFTTGWHQVFGVFAFIGFMIQYGMGLFSHFRFDPARKAPPVFPDKIHWWLGRGVLVWSLLTIYFGLGVYGAPAGAWVLYSFWLVIAIAAVVVLQRKMGQSHEVSDNQYHYHDADDMTPTDRENRTSQYEGEGVQKTPQSKFQEKLPYYVLGGVMVFTVAFILIGVVAELNSDSS